jgi:hypothetical protein
MRQAVPLLATMLFAMVLLASGTETGIAEPQKNQISVDVECDNGEEYTLVFKGEGNAGHVLELAGPNNIIPKSYTVKYLVLETGEVITDEFSRGNWEGEEDLIHCEGETETEIFGLGKVKAVFSFEGLVTPRST